MQLSELENSVYVNSNLQQQKCYLLLVYFSIMYDDDNSKNFENLCVMSEETS